MAVAEHGALLGDLIVQRGTLRPQDAQQILLHRTFHVGLEVALRLLIAGFGFFRAQACSRDLLGEIGDA